MAEVLNIVDDASREDQYKNLIPQIKGLLSGESDMIANMANVSAVLKQAFDFLWVGFYLIKDNQLVLAPFQGKIACTRINYGKGVCGTAWEQNETLVVDDVDSFDGHIACDGDSRSEIVVPVHHNGSIIGVLDIDSQYLKHFTETDKKYLEEIVSVLSQSIS